MINQRRYAMMTVATDESMPSRPPSSPSSRRSGIVLLLVLFAVATAVVLGAAFLGAQSTSTGIARNADRHAVARQIAESGLMMGVHYVQEDADWRTNKSHGVWVADQPLLDGTFTLLGEDELDGDLSNNTTDPVTLTAIGAFEGVTHVVSAEVQVITSGGGGGLTAGGLALSTNVELTGSAVIDSWDSSQGSYWQTQGSNAQVITNETANNTVKITGSSSIKGDVVIGPGGNLNTAINAPAWNSQAITGSRSVADEPVVIEANELPTFSGLGAYQGNKSYVGGGSTTVSQSMHVNKFTTGGSRTVNINGDVVIYCEDDFSIGGSSRVNVNGDVVIYCGGDFSVGGSGQLQIAQGGSLTIYVVGDVSVVGSGTLNTNGADPADLQLHTLGSGTVSMVGSAQMYGRIRAPDSPLEITGSAEFFGIYQGHSVSLTGSAKFHQDLAPLDSSGGGGGGGGGGGQTTTVKVRWMENP